MIEQFVDSYGQWSETKIFAKAEREDAVIERTSPHVLLIDIDDAEQLSRFVIAREHLKKVLTIDKDQRWTSKSGGTHVKLTVTSAMTMEERLFWQALLGSDPLREALSWKALCVGVLAPSVLFRPRGAKVWEVSP